TVDAATGLGPTSWNDPASAQLCKPDRARAKTIRPATSDSSVFVRRHLPVVRARARIPFGRANARERDPDHRRLRRRRGLEHLKPGPGNAGLLWRSYLGAPRKSSRGCFV